MFKHATNRIATRIVDAIKREVAAGALRPGDRLPPERLMVRQHHVSRVSVREAYRALEDTGLVTVRRGSTGGTFIASPGPGVFGEGLALALRLADSTDRQAQEASLVEPLVAALAARHATRSDLSRLRKLVSADSWTRGGRFHLHLARVRLAIADAAHNIPLAAVVRSIADVSTAAYARLQGVDGFVEACCRWHRGLYDAIAAGDAAAAGQQMHDYLCWLQAQTDSAPPAAPTSPGERLAWFAA